MFYVYPDAESVGGRIRRLSLDESDRNSRLSSPDESFDNSESGSSVFNNKTGENMGAVWGIGTITDDDQVGTG